MWSEHGLFMGIKANKANKLPHCAFMHPKNDAVLSTATSLVQLCWLSHHQCPHGSLHHHNHLKDLLGPIQKFSLHSPSVNSFRPLSPVSPLLCTPHPKPLRGVIKGSSLLMRGSKKSGLKSVVTQKLEKSWNECTQRKQRGCGLQRSKRKGAKFTNDQMIASCFSILKNKILNILRIEVVSGFSDGCFTQG